MRALILALFISSNIPMPEKITEVVRIGCICEQIVEPDNRTQRWHTKVYVEYKNSTRWQKLYSIRGGNERKKALKDCDFWMSEYYKRAKKEKK